MADPTLKDVSNGYAYAWDQAKAKRADPSGTAIAPEDFLTRDCTSTDPKKQAEYMGRRQAARDFLLIEANQPKP